jgi:hypothetical protein
MASIAEAFSPALLAAKADMGARSDRPVFIVGLPHTGTTLIEQILASHPMVYGAGGLKRLQKLIDGMERFPASVANLAQAHEALRLGVIVRIATPTHRADQTMAEQGFPITLSGVLRTAIAVMHATWRRLSPLDRSLKRGKRQADVDRAADCITDRPARPGVEDDRDIGEALVDGDIGYVRNPELVGSVNRQLSGSIGIDRLIMIAVGRRDVTAPPAWLKVVLAHQASDLLVIDDHATMPQLGANASPAIEFELVAGHCHI